MSGLGFVLYAGTTLAFLLPGLDPLLFLPLLLYVFVNSVLWVLSVLRTSNVALSRASRACAVLGALLWVASDTLLGIDRYPAAVAKTVFMMLARESAKGRSRLYQAALSQ